MRIYFSFLMCYLISLGSCAQKASNQQKELNNVKTEMKVSNKNLPLDTITLGGGCYWCVEAVYEMLEGVVSVESGFAGGNLKNPTYHEVCTGNTGHAEVVQIVYNTGKMDVMNILKVFFTVHDPTTINRQGGDVGTQYRSVIFYRNDYQQKLAGQIIDQLNAEKVFDMPVVTSLEKFIVFYRAEDEHQDYYMLNKEKPYCRMVIQPKIEKFEKLFKSRLRNHD